MFDFFIFEDIYQEKPTPNAVIIIFTTHFLSYIFLSFFRCSESIVGAIGSWLDEDLNIQYKNEKKKNSINSNEIFAMKLFSYESSDEVRF